MAKQLEEPFSFYPTRGASTLTENDEDVPLAPIDASLYSEKNFDVITSIFMPDNDASLPLEEVLHHSGFSLEDIECIDYPIDQDGHTALHWAATLGNVALVRQLIGYGAHPLRGNYKGETPLIRTVMVTNSSDLDNFSDLLDILYGCIKCLDNQHRSILHHLSLNAGIKGKGFSSKYYLQNLFEWIVSKGKHYDVDLSFLMNSLINLQDKNGDTCLNIAARIGNKSILSELVDVGANGLIPNKAGLRPIDFGLNLPGNHTSPPAPIEESKLDLKSGLVLEKMQQMLKSLDSDFHRELSEKQVAIDNMRRTLREKTLKLSQNRTSLEMVTDSEARIKKLSLQIENLEKCIDKEEYQFREATQKQFPNFHQFEGDFDADEPFTCWPVYNYVEQRYESEGPDCLNHFNLNEIAAHIPQEALPPASVLKARIKAYKENQKYLESFSDSLLSKSSDLERKFKKVVSLCIGIEEENIDGILDSLVSAVENGVAI